jgi:hypothetical protein
MTSRSDGYILPCIPARSCKVPAGRAFGQCACSTHRCVGNESRVREFADRERALPVFRAFLGDDPQHGGPPVGNGAGEMFDEPLPAFVAIELVVQERIPERSLCRGCLGH